MAPSVSSHAQTAPRKMLTMRGETLRKPLAMDEFKAVIGRAIERALLSAAITKQQAAFAMGYGENQAPVSRWVSGIETPQFAKLWELGPRFRQELVLALAAECSGLEIETVIRRKHA